MTSMSNRAPKGSRWETVRLCLPGYLVGSSFSLNCVKPNAVRMDMMFVSWEKSRYIFWFKGNVSVEESRVVLIWEPEYPRVWFFKRATNS